MRNFLFVLFVLAIGTFFFLKVKIEGDPQSNFNQKTRYSLGVNGFFRGLLGLHKAGDAKKEYLTRQDGVLIEWFKPLSEEVNEQVAKDFAEKVGQALGRPTAAVFAGAVDDGVLDTTKLDAFELKATVQKTKATTVILVFFAKDYEPRKDGEIATNYNESGIVVSMDALKQYLSGYPQQINNHLLGNLLKQFGRQIGLKESDDAACVMGLKNTDYYGQKAAEDFCADEKGEINSVKLQLLGN